MLGAPDNLRQPQSVAPRKQQDAQLGHGSLELSKVGVARAWCHIAREPKEKVPKLETTPDQNQGLQPLPPSGLGPGLRGSHGLNALAEA